jgi:hypothetical protein
VGRCSAQIDREHLRVWKDDTGFFGFFDTIDDDAVGKKLIEARGGLAARAGMKRMWGPFSLYANEEIGILIEGHESPAHADDGALAHLPGPSAEAVGSRKRRTFSLGATRTGASPSRPAPSRRGRT